MFTKLSDFLKESATGPTITLYHGTNVESAKKLLADGFVAKNYVVLYTQPFDALYVAKKTGSDIVLKLSDIPESSLEFVDDDATMFDNDLSVAFDKAKRHVPGRFMLKGVLSSEHISEYGEMVLPTLNRKKTLFGK